MARPKKPIKLEVTALLFGLAACMSSALIILLPPLLSPTGESFWMWILSFLFVVSVPATLISTFYGIVHRNWRVVPAFALAVLIFLPIRALNGPAENLWLEKFVSSQPLRQEFLAFMDRQNTNENRVRLPESLKGLSDGAFAYLTTDKSGGRFYCYSVFTHGIDNSRGYCWSQNGQPPGEMAFPKIVRSKALGGGWFLFSST